MNSQFTSQKDNSLVKSTTEPKDNNLKDDKNIKKIENNNNIQTKISQNTLQRSLEFFKKKIKDLEQNNGELEHINKEIKQKFEETKQELEVFRQDNKETKRINEEIKRVNEKIKQDFEEIKKANEEMKRVNEEMKSEIKNIKQEFEEIKRENEEMKLVNENFTNLAMDYETNMLDNFNKDDCIEFINHKLVILGECVINDQDKDQKPKDIKFNIVSVEKSHDVITLKTNYKNYSFKMELESVDKNMIMLISNFNFKINTDTPRSMGSNKIIADITNLINLSTYEKLYNLLSN
jgi:hypothetical protein